MSGEGASLRRALGNDDDLITIEAEQNIDGFRPCPDSERDPRSEDTRFDEALPERI